MTLFTKVPSTKLISGPLYVKVTAGVIRRAGRVLIAQRSPNDLHPPKWEFPIRLQLRRVLLEYPLNTPSAWKIPAPAR